MTPDSSSSISATIAASSHSYSILTAGVILLGITVLITYLLAHDLPNRVRSLTSSAPTGTNIPPTVDQLKHVESTDAQVTLEELMHQAMKKMTQTMTQKQQQQQQPFGPVISGSFSGDSDALIGKIRRTLPAGYEVGVTVHGRIYYIDHLSQKTTWDHPIMNEVQDPQRFIQGGDINWEALIAYMNQRHPTGTASYYTESQSVVRTDNTIPQPLPAGWEQATTKEGIPYFVNHTTRQTSWVDPRTQKPGAASTQTVYLLKRYKEQVWAELRTQSAVSVVPAGAESAGGKRQQQGRSSSSSVLADSTMQGAKVRRISSVDNSTASLVALTPTTTTNTSTTPAAVSLYMNTTTTTGSLGVEASNNNGSTREICV